MRPIPDAARSTALALSLALATGGAIALALSAPLDATTPPANLKLPEPPPEKPSSGDQVAVLAGGCFWGMEGLYEHVKGVKSVTSGYAGGTRDTANYQAVSSERTGHAEAIRIVYDSGKISYGTLLKVYFSIAHDPTQVNGQHPDEGPSYRSAIFPQNAAQRTLASTYMAAITKSGAFGKPLATKLETGAFYPAEDYHQDFMRRHPDHGYIVQWDKPKLAAFKARYSGLYKS